MHTKGYIVMKITINSHTVNSSNPLIVSYKFVMDTDNGLRYDFNSFDKEQFTEHSLLLVDNESYIVKGYFTLETENAQNNVFPSVDGNGSIDLGNAIQLKIESLSIPEGWLNTDCLSEIFTCWQHDCRAYYEEQRVVVWFVHNNYHMCPVATNVNDNEYEHFSQYMTNLFSDILSNI